MILALGAVFSALLAVVQPAQTATGIPLDAAWKVTIYDLARAKFHHPAWGWQHSERNYRIALELAKATACASTPTFSSAAAFLHDMAAFMPCVDPKLEHGECAAQQTGAILPRCGVSDERSSPPSSRRARPHVLQQPGKATGGDRAARRRFAGFLG